jgi:hypothetical protein
MPSTRLNQVPASIRRIVVAASLATACLTSSNPLLAGAAGADQLAGSASTQASSAHGSLLEAGGTLLVGEQLRSPDGRTTLIMHPDGNLALWGQAGLVWWVGSSIPGTVARQQSDGNLALYGPDDELIWFASPNPVPGATLMVRDDSTLTLSSSGNVWWAAANHLHPGSELPSGGALRSPDGRTTLSMGADGNLALWGPGGLVWWVGDSTPGTVARMQADGNVALYAPDGRLVWFALPAPNAGSVLVVRNDASIALAKDGQALWTQTATPELTPRQRIASSCPNSAPVGTVPTSLGSVKDLCVRNVLAARHDRAGQAIVTAFQDLGRPYSQAAPARTTTHRDCSSLVSLAYISAGATGFRVPGGVANTAIIRGSLAARGVVMSINGVNARPGDLLFPSAGHVAMRLDGGAILHTNAYGRPARIEAGKGTYGTYAAYYVP